MENPKHRDDQVSIWEMPSILEILNRRGVKQVIFDQCMLGLETTKPTLIAHDLIDLNELQDKRCNHEKVKQVDAKGKEYYAAHPSAVQRWRSKGDGTQERASKALGDEYTPELSILIARAFHQLQQGESWLEAELSSEPLPWADSAALTPKTLRETENEAALGGMRQPERSVSKQPKAVKQGQVIAALLDKIIDKWPEVQETASSILRGEEAKEWNPTITELARRLTLKVLNVNSQLPDKSTRASTPLCAEVIEAWGANTEDVDSAVIAKWLRTGAPLGFLDPIPTTGVFPPVEGPRWEDEALRTLARGLEDWTNYTSALEEFEDLQTLMADCESRGFCHFVKGVQEATLELGRAPIVNKLGMVVKIKEGKKKSRIVWDLRESRANLACSQGERILLPRLDDVAQSALNVYKAKSTPWLAVVDVKDAFMNIPAGPDKFATASAVPTTSNPHGEHKIAIFDVLVFGSTSSPTLWGRFAAWLGRSLAAVAPTATTAIYVDDPIFVLQGDLQVASKTLARILLWTNVAGFPLKLEKASGGKQVEWVGAKLVLDDDNQEVKVSIPTKKVEAMQETNAKFLARPVIGPRELRSYAGSLAFLAGLVPHLRPFLSSIWAALSGCGGSTNDGAKRAGKLIHTKRIKAALCWIEGLLGGGPAPLVRTLSTKVFNVKAEIVTDACPFGMGGVLRVNHKVVEFFSCPLEEALLAKFKAKTGESKHNTLWEAVALLIATRLWLRKMQYGATVRLKSDNLSALRMLLKGRARPERSGSWIRPWRGPIGV